MDPKNWLAARKFLELADLTAYFHPSMEISEGFIWWKDKFGLNVHNNYTVLFSFFELGIGSNLECTMLHNLDKVGK